MKKAYIAIKYEQGNEKFLDALKKIISASGYTPYAFVDEGFVEDEKEMMELAFRKLEESDVLIADGSSPALGVGIEVGYFLRTKKPIIAVFKEGKMSRTLFGVATKVVIYSSEEELRFKLLEALK